MPEIRLVTGPRSRLRHMQFRGSSHRSTLPKRLLYLLGMMLLEMPRFSLLFMPSSGCFRQSACSN